MNKYSGSTSGKPRASRRPEYLKKRDGASANKGYPAGAGGAQNNGNKKYRANSKNSLKNRPEYKKNSRSSISNKANKKSDSAYKTGRIERKSGGLVKSSAELRAIKEYKSEKEWQESVERIHGGTDKIMLSIILLLVTLGAVMVFSASYPTAINESGDGFYYLKKHLMFMGIGAVLMFGASIVPYRYYKAWGPFVAYGVSMLLLAAVLVMGTSEGEAKRWIYIGSFSIQPSEIMKVSLVMALAWYIDKYRESIKRRAGFAYTFKYNVLYPALFIGPACGMVLLEKHLSGTAILGILSISVLLVGGCSIKYNMAAYGIAGTLAAGAFIALNPYALKRITTFTSDNVDVLNEGWQTFQGILAIGSGGPFGLGFGGSNQKHSYVSMAHNDFIFTIWCEELGFVGALFLILLFIAFIWRGYVIAMRAPDTFSMLTVFGIVTQVGLQAFLNMMVVCDIIPNTGISLPFFSYGGSSLVMLMAEMGIILSISRQFYRKKEI